MVQTSQLQWYHEIMYILFSRGLSGGICVDRRTSLEDLPNAHTGNYKHQIKLRMSSSGMLRRVAFVKAEVSEELSASFIKVTRIGELGSKLAVTSNQRKLRRNTT
jgi:hypothetical protein